MQIKKGLLSFIVINIVYIVYFFLLMIWLKQPVIGFRQGPPVQLPPNLIMIIQAVMSLLSLLIFGGLIYVLSAFKEAFHIKFAVAVYALFQLILNCTAFFKALYLFVITWSKPISYINYAVLLWLAISLLLVSEKSIRGYYRWFGICVLLSVALVSFLPYLYQTYGLMRYYINPGIIKLPPFVVSLVMFLRVYSDQPKSKKNV